MESRSGSDGYQRLARAVIAQAVEDFRAPLPRDPQRRAQVLEDQLDAGTFLLDEEDPFWFQAAGIDVDRFREGLPVEWTWRLVALRTLK